MQPGRIRTRCTATTDESPPTFATDGRRAAAARTVRITDNPGSSPEFADALREFAAGLATLILLVVAAGVSDRLDREPRAGPVIIEPTLEATPARGVIHVRLAQSVRARLDRERILSARLRACGTARNIILVAP